MKNANRRRRNNTYAAFAVYGVLLATTVASVFTSVSSVGGVNFI